MNTSVVAQELDARTALSRPPLIEDGHFGVLIKRHHVRPRADIIPSPRLLSMTVPYSRPGPLLHQPRGRSGEGPSL